MKRQAGFTLIETLVALLLMAIIVVTIMSAFSSMTIAATRHQQVTQLDRLTRSDIEYVKSQPYQPKPGTYANLSVPSFAFSLQMSYWDRATGTFAATNADAGLQEIVLKISGPNGITESVTFLKVQP